MNYFYLFIIAFVSATLFPLGSEGFLIYTITAGFNIYILLFCATLGNVLGSCVNYFLGLKGEQYLEEKSYLKSGKVNYYKGYFDRFGGFTLLLSWLPIIGDPITFVAGVFKYNFKWFVFFVTVAKMGRYIVIAIMVSYLT